jgi:glycosyltransferase involved in cell wall biosynthesis
MKILIPFNGSFPNGLAMTKRLKLYTKGLIEIGNDVQIIIPHATERYDSINDNLVFGSFEGTPFRYLSKSKIRSKYFLARRLNDFLGYFNLIIKIFFKYSDADIIFLIDIRNSWRIPIYLISKSIGAKVIYELNEHPLIFSNRIKYWFEKRIIFRLFDGFIVISENLKLLVSSIVKNKCVVLKVPIIKENKELIEEYADINSDLDKNFIIHSGGLYETKEGITTILNAVHLVNKNSSFDLYLYFTGDLIFSTDSELIKQTITKFGLSEKVKFLGYLNENDLVLYQKKSVLSLIIKPNNVQNNYCFPTKLGEYMALEKIIIATNVGEYMNYLTDGFNALIVEPNDPVSISDNIIKVLNNVEFYRKLGVNAKLTSDEFFDYKVQTQNINSYFNNIILI